MSTDVPGPGLRTSKKVKRRLALASAAVIWPLVSCAGFARPDSPASTTAFHGHATANGLGAATVAIFPSSRTPQDAAPQVVDIKFASASFQPDSTFVARVSLWGNTTLYTVRPPSVAPTTPSYFEHLLAADGTGALVPNQSSPSLFLAPVSALGPYLGDLVVELGGVDALQLDSTGSTEVDAVFPAQTDPSATGSVAIVGSPQLTFLKPVFSSDEEGDSVEDGWVEVSKVAVNQQYSLPIGAGQYTTFEHEGTASFKVLVTNLSGEPLSGIASSDFALSFGPFCCTASPPVQSDGIRPAEFSDLGDGLYQEAFRVTVPYATPSDFAFTVSIPEAIP